MNLKIKRSFLIGLTALWLSACGGNGSHDSSPTTTVAGGPTSGPSANNGCVDRASAVGIEGGGYRHISGVITGVGSSDTLVVGCDQFFTAGALVFVNGTPGTLGDLSIGQVVTVFATVNPETGLSEAAVIYVNGTIADGSIAAVRLGVSFAPTVRGTWYMFDGPEYAVSPTTTVVIDGEPVPVDGLAIDEGEVVLLQGILTFDAEHNPGGLLTAQRLEIRHMIDGTVDSIDLEHARLTVLGQTVVVDGGTIVESGGDVGGPTGLASAHVGDRLTVSGHPSQSGAVVASRIAPSQRTGDFQVTGFVRSLDPVRHQFAIGGLDIDYQAAGLRGFSVGGSSNGDLVLVRGTRAGGTALTATSVLYEAAPFMGAYGATASLRGIVTSVTSPSAVTVDGHPIVITDTALRTCGTPPVLDKGAILEGKVLADGTVVADAFCLAGFDLRAPGQGYFFPSVGVAGPIDSIDAQFGTLSILGFRLQPALTSLIVDITGVVMPVSDLRPGDHVLTSNSNGPSDDVLTLNAAWGLAPGLLPTLYVNSGHFSISDPDVFVHGHQVRTDDSTTYHIINNTNHASVPFSRAAFFAGEKSWPFYDKICRPSIRIEVRENGDGSLTATSVLVEPDYC